MDGVCAGSNGSCHDTRRASRKLSLPLSSIGSKIDISCSPSTRDVRVPSCGIRPPSPFHALSIPSSILDGCSREREIVDRVFVMQKPSLFPTYAGMGISNPRYLSHSRAKLSFRNSSKDGVIVETFLLKILSYISR